MTGMEQFNLPNKRKYGKSIHVNSTTNGCFLSLLEPAKGQGKKGSSNMAGGKNPLANSMAHHSNVGKNPGTSHMDHRGAKLYEIYSSGKSNGGGGGNQGGHVASNISNGSGGSQG